ncbi:MAG: hypothetical protein E7138_07100 [Rikenellaceae bacterium]|nr:hypothetical protein [Rikenellaceae bacterium]
MPNPFCRTLAEKLPPPGGTFPDKSRHIFGTLHQYRTHVCCYTYIYNIGTEAPTKIEFLINSVSQRVSTHYDAHTQQLTASVVWHPAPIIWHPASVIWHPDPP